nr:GntR family transcriptional regulator [Sulfitobacter sp. M22]
MLLVDATAALRSKILSGTFDVGKKLREVTVAEELDVSRTIARLAMSTLEHEGLLVREPNRGSWIRLFSIEEIADAIEVRGELEAMAARKVAEHGLSDESIRTFQAIIDDSDTLLKAGVRSAADQSTWRELNVSYHATLISASQSRALPNSIEQISHLPLVSTSAIVFDKTDDALGQHQLEDAFADHVEIFDAMKARQGMRAADRMREHAYKNAQNKRRNLADPKAMKAARALPGGALIAQSNHTET